MVWFEMILVTLTLLTGLIWLLDRLFFAKRRASADGLLDETKEPVVVDYARAFFPVLAVVLMFLLALAAFGFMLAKRGETYEVRPEERQRDLILATLAVIYTLFMIYAGGLKFILLSAILFAPGTVLYFWSRREQGKAVFNKTSDWVTFGVIVAAGVYGVFGLATGVITI